MESEDVIILDQDCSEDECPDSPSSDVSTDSVVRIRRRNVIKSRFEAEFDSTKTKHSTSEEIINHKYRNQIFLSLITFAHQPKKVQ